MTWWSKWSFGEGKHEKEDLALLAGNLVLTLMKTLEGPSAEALKHLSIACGSQAGLSTIKIEILLFHKFLLVQACAFEGAFSQAVINKVVRQLDDAFVFYCQERMDLSIEESNTMQAAGVLRARQYDEPFHIDRNSSESDRGGLPWERLLVTFCRNVRIPSDEGQIFRLHPAEAEQACLAIEATLDALIEHVGKTMISHLRPE